MASLVNERDKVISESIHVYIRLRPELNILSADLDDSDAEEESEEKGEESGGKDGSGRGGRGGSGRITSLETDGKCVYGHEDSEAVSLSGRKSSSNSSVEFKFDACLGAASTQEEVYAQCAKPIVDSALRGYSGTILAYGPTGSGKTFTMRGKGADRGIIPRCMEQILRETHGTVEVRVSYLQIYCETVGDLLNPDMAHLSIRERSGGTVYVENISSARVASLEDLEDMLHKGDANRSTAATLKNATSSRSHAALIVNLNIPDGDDSSSSSSNGKQVSCKEASLVLVDLAGSERHEASAGRYLRLEEAKAINLSLSALGNCMNALAEGRPHVPYRDSKLTRLLQGTLGGGARTSVIINLAPGIDATGESLNALRFASRASKVKVVSKVARFVDYEALYRAAQSELDRAQERLLKNEKSLGEAELRAEREEARAGDLQHQVDILRQMMKLKESQEDVRRRTNGGDGDESKQHEEKEEAERKARHDDAAAAWEQEMREMAENHLLDLSANRNEWAGKVAKAKREAANFKTAVAKEQDALLVERENHLATLQELNACRARLKEEEASRSRGISDTLAELDERRRDVEDLERSVRAEKAEIESMRETMATMVSKTQLADMEKLFADTVGVLTARLEQMESGESGGRGSENRGDNCDDDDEWSLGSPRELAPSRPKQQPQIPNPTRRPAYNSTSVTGPGQSKSGARIEIGRVRKVGGASGGSKW